MAYTLGLWDASVVQVCFEAMSRLPIEVLPFFLKELATAGAFVPGEQCICGCVVVRHPGEVERSSLAAG